MGVYIKGKTMPQNGCSRCFNDECLLPYSEYVPKGNRHPNCPLIEVKTPHGRLIDADALVTWDDGYGQRCTPIEIIDDALTVIEMETE